MKGGVYNAHKSHQPTDVSRWLKSNTIARKRDSSRGWRMNWWKSLSWHPDSTPPPFLLSLLHLVSHNPDYEISPTRAFYEQRIPPSLTWAWSLSPRASVANTVQGISPSLPAAIYQAKSTAGTPGPGTSLFKALIRDTVTGKRRKRGRDTSSDFWMKYFLSFFLRGFMQHVISAWLSFCIYKFLSC